MSSRLFTPVFFLVFVANLFTGVAWALSVHFPAYLETLGAAEVEIGLIFGSAAVAAVAVRPWIGKVLDTRGRRLVIVGGQAVQLLAVVLYLTVDAVGLWVYVVRILHGIGIGTLFTSLSTYAADIIPMDRRTQGLAVFGVSGMLPIAMAGLIGDLVISGLGFDAFFWTWVTVAALATVASLPLPDTRPEDHDGTAPAGFLASLGSPSLRPLWLITLVFGIGLAAYFTFMATFVREVGFGSVGLFFATYGGAAIVERLSIGWLPDRVGQKRVLFPALAAMVGGFVVLATAGSWQSIAVAGVLCGTGHGFTFPILYSLTVTRARPADRGSAVAIYTALFDLGQLLAGPLWGALIVVFGYSGMFLAVGAFLVMGAAAFGVWDRSAPRREGIPAPAAAR